MNKFTTNVHVPNVRPATRVKVTVDEAGSLTWCEVYENGELRGCGPVPMVAGPVLEAVNDRLSFTPPSSFPMYWRDKSKEKS